MNGYITLDYELCMGISGTPEKCLFEPMSHLTAMLDKYGIKTNLFVDTAYLLQLYKLKESFPQLKKDYDAVVNHIRKLEDEGHSIQLHLHPQWCYSSYDGVNWNLDRDHYKLSDMPLTDQKRIIHESAELLNSIIKNKVTAFRAGGYSIENFSDLFETLLSEGIKIDSSVFRGEHAKSKYQTYDYRKIPPKSSYQFEYNHKAEVEGGRMREYPLSTIVVDPFTYLINKYSKNKEYKKICVSKEKWGDGVGIGYPGGQWNALMLKFKQLFGSKAICTYIEIGDNIERVYKYSTKHYTGNDFVIIGHPKGFSPYSIALLELFIINHSELEFKVF